MSDDATAAGSSFQRPGPGPCLAVTRTGVRCKGVSAPGEAYCFRHGGSSRAARDLQAAWRRSLLAGLRCSMGVPKEAGPCQ
jgi:hypothetical protein